jgi:hypothetical protein
MPRFSTLLQKLMTDNISLITQQYDNHDQFKDHRGGLGSSPGQVVWDLWWTKWHWGRFYPSTSVSPASSSFYQQLHIHHLSFGAGTIGQILADVPSGLSFTPPQETKKKKKN